MSVTTLGELLKLVGGLPASTPLSLDPERKLTIGELTLVIPVQPTEEERKGAEMVQEELDDLNIDIDHFPDFPGFLEKYKEHVREHVKEHDTLSGEHLYDDIHEWLLGEPLYLLEQRLGKEAVEQLLGKQLDSAMTRIGKEDVEPLLEEPLTSMMSRLNMTERPQDPLKWMIHQLGREGVDKLMAKFKSYKGDMNKMLRKTGLDITKLPPEFEKWYANWHSTIAGPPEYLEVNNKFFLDELAKWLGYSAKNLNRPLNKLEMWEYAKPIPSQINYLMHPVSQHDFKYIPPVSSPPQVASPVPSIQLPLSSTQIPLPSSCTSPSIPPTCATLPLPST